MSQGKTKPARREMVAEVRRVGMPRTNGQRCVLWPERKRKITCSECGHVIVATLLQAQRHGWALWVGGAVCTYHDVVELEERRFDTERDRRDEAAELYPVKP